MKKNVGILIFKNVEVLDFAGPFEVFAISSEIHDHKLFNTFLVSSEKNPVEALNGLVVIPSYSFDDAPHIDILIIAGGAGTGAIKEDERYLKWVDKACRSSEYVLSICSGARILAKLKMLENNPFCTHHEVYNEILEMVPSSKPQRDKRFVNFGNIYTSGGISAGIDLSFHVLRKIHGEEVADKTAKYMEYSINTEAPTFS
jgi:transcriptional regulator GlxA family with amidase domain